MYEPMPEIFGDRARPRWLNEIVSDAVEAREREPDAGAGEALRQESLLMQQLGAALVDLDLVRLSLDYGFVIYQSDTQLATELEKISECKEYLVGRVKSNRSRIQAADSLLDDLRRIQRASADFDQRPSYLRAVVEWSKEAPVDLSDSIAREALAGDLEQMLRELRTQVRLRRTVWTQLKRQAELAAQLGPR